MPEPTTAELLKFLADYVTENKRGKMDAALEYRTRHLTVVLEDIYQPHNATACLRSCDCLGVQDVHVIEKRNRFKPNGEVAMGAMKWLSIDVHEKMIGCMKELKSKGYRLVATTPNENGPTPATLPLDQPTALLFGTEDHGLSEEALEMADDTLHLPMVGFTQSYNISVTVAVTLSRLVERLHAGEIGDVWKLDPESKEELLLSWYRKIVRSHKHLVDREFFDDRPDADRTNVLP